MFVLLLVLLMSDGSYKSPPALPLFFSMEACEALSEQLTDAIKEQTHAEHVIYHCTRVVPVNEKPA